MKALFFIACILLASSLFIPTITMARELVEKEGPLSSNSSPVSGGANNPTKPVKCPPGVSYASCISRQKPAPNCRKTYARNCNPPITAP